MEFGDVFTHVSYCTITFLVVPQRKHQQPLQLFIPPWMTEEFSEKTGLEVFAYLIQVFISLLTYYMILGLNYKQTNKIYSILTQSYNVWGARAWQIWILGFMKAKGKNKRKQGIFLQNLNVYIESLLHITFGCCGMS